MEMDVCEDTGSIPNRSTCMFYMCMNSLMLEYSKRKLLFHAESHTWTDVCWVEFARLYFLALSSRRWKSHKNYIIKIV